MKANGAPEKIYILHHKDYSDRRIMNAFTEKESNTDIEYTRTDAFMKKADEFIGSFFHPDDTEFRNCILKKFHKYMKGE